MSNGVATERRFVALALTGVLAFAMIACATRPPPFRGILRGTEEISRGPITPTGVELTAEVGAPIYQVGTRTVEQTITGRLLEPVNAELEVGHTLKLRADTTGTLMKRSIDGSLVMCFNTSGAGMALQLFTGGGHVSGCLVDNDKDGRFDASMFARYERKFPLASSARYDVLSKSETDRYEFGSVKRELLYQGSGGGVIRLSYREFSRNDFARPAFTQDLTYDMDQNGTAMIGFRGLRIRVLEAGNQLVRFVVEQPMS